MARKGHLSGNKNPAKRLDVRKKISQACKGRIISKQQREDISNTLKGKLATHSQDCTCIICQVKRGWQPPHDKKNCKCYICKSRRGEYYGETHPRWKGGCSSENLRLRKSKRFKDWQKAVFKRDKYTCLICGQVSGNLNPHHILPFADFPKHRFNVDNGMTLCRKNHYILHNKLLWQGIYNSAFG